MCCAVSGNASANVITPGWWSTGYNVGYCVYDKNIIPSLPFLETGIGKFETGASQYTTCGNGKWISRNSHGYQAQMICTTVGVNGQRKITVNKIIFRKESKSYFFISIDGGVTEKYAITYKLTKNARLLNSHGLTQKKSGCANPLWLQNVLLKKLVAVNKPTFRGYRVTDRHGLAKRPSRVDLPIQISMVRNRVPERFNHVCERLFPLRPGHSHSQVGDD